MCFTMLLHLVGMVTIAKHFCYSAKSQRVSNIMKNLKKLFSSELTESVRADGRLLAEAEDPYSNVTAAFDELAYVG